MPSIKRQPGVSFHRRELVKRGNILAWLKHLEHAPLYVASGVRIDWSRLGVFDDDDAAVCEGERAQGGDDADDVETVLENIDLDDPVQLAIALNAMSKTIFFNEEGCEKFPEDAGEFQRAGFMAARLIQVAI
ncbi:hypothetical protein MRX96_051120 [Rhipicephalus microplus]